MLEDKKVPAKGTGKARQKNRASQGCDIELFQI